MQQGGGIGHDFSTLRPKGALVHGVGADASGPVSFMDVWDAMCKTIMSAGSRRGAMMGTLRCDHPDIEAFIEAKADPLRLRNFNLSVLVTDAFLEAVKTDAPWPLAFGGEVYRTLSARGLWHKIMRSAYDYAEPGVIFIDRVNALNNLSYCEKISSTNPCGEQPLPPYGACLLGSVNLAALIEEPFTPAARLDGARLEALVPTAVRLLDNIIDVSRYPLPAQEKEAKAKRRIGLGVTGLADALILCGKHYGSEEGRDLARALDGEDRSHGLRGKRGAGEGEGRISAVRRGRVPETAVPKLAAARLARRNRKARDQERRADLDRANGHDFAAGRQRVERDRAGVRFRIPPPHPRRGRHAQLRNRRGLRRAPVPGIARRGAAPGRIRHGAPAFAATAYPHAGRTSALCRRVDFEDRELP